MHTAECLHIVGCIGPGIGVTLTVSTTHTIHIAGLDSATQILAEVLCVLDTEVAFQCQAINRFDVNVGIAEDAPRLISVVTTVIQFMNRVGNVGATENHRIGKDTIAVGDRDSRVLTHSGVRYATVIARAVTTVVPLGNHQVLTHAEHLTNIISGIDTGSIAAVKGVVHQSVLIDIVARKHIGTLVGAIAHTG